MNIETLRNVYKERHPEGKDVPNRYKNNPDWIMSQFGIADELLGDDVVVLDTPQLRLVKSQKKTEEINPEQETKSEPFQDTLPEESTKSTDPNIHNLTQEQLFVWNHVNSNPAFEFMTVNMRGYTVDVPNQTMYQGNFKII